jgi:type IV pilus assembly protein PilV
MAFIRSKYCHFNNKNRFLCSPHQVPVPRPSGNAGFSLIEVLVSILILAIGVIGTAGMQLAAARTTQQSALQTVALELASEMSDKIRANHRISNSNMAGTYLSVDYDSDRQGAPTPPSKLCFGVECNSIEVAAFDIYDWEKRIRSDLPGGRVRICRDAHPWSEASRSLQWGCAAAESDDSVPIVIKVGWQGKNPDGSLVRNSDKEFPPAVALAVTSYAE